MLLRLCNDVCKTQRACVCFFFICAQQLHGEYIVNGAGGCCWLPEHHHRAIPFALEEVRGGG